jgi:hypothetical protein
MEQPRIGEKKDRGKEGLHQLFENPPFSWNDALLEGRNGFVCVNTKCSRRARTTARAKN